MGEEPLLSGRGTGESLLTEGREERVSERDSARGDGLEDSGAGTGLSVTVVFVEDDLGRRRRRRGLSELSELPEPPEMKTPPPFKVLERASSRLGLSLLRSELLLSLLADLDESREERRGVLSSEESLSALFIILSARSVSR